MKAKRNNKLILAIRVELQKEIDQIQNKVTSWEEEMTHCQLRLLQLSQYNNNDAFRLKAMSRLQKRIDTLERKMELYQEKIEKRQNCLVHLPKLKNLANGLISKSSLSYHFKEKYIPEYKRILLNLDLPLTTEREELDWALLPERTSGGRPAPMEEGIAEGS